MPRAFCSAVPAAGTMPDEHAVAPLGAASRSKTSTSAPALRAASAAVAPAPPAPITTTEAAGIKARGRVVHDPHHSVARSAGSLELLFDPVRRMQRTRVRIGPADHLHA